MEQISMTISWSGKATSVVFIALLNSQTRDALADPKPLIFSALLRETPWNFHRLMMLPGRHFI